MADQGREERYHHACDAGHLHQQAEEDEHRHGQQKQVRHALIHAIDHERREGRALVRPRYDMVAMPKAKAIGTPMPTHTATMTTKNTIRLPKPMSK